VVHDWLQTGFRQVLVGKETPSSWVIKLYNASQQLNKDKPIKCDPLYAVKGGRLMSRSIYDYRDIISKSFKRDGTSLCRYAIQEYVIVRKYREPLINDHQVVRTIRRSLKALLNAHHKSQNQFVGGQMANVKTEWTWLEELDNRDHEGAVLSLSLEELAVVNQEQQDLLKMQISISNFVETIEKNPIMHLHNTHAVVGETQ
jgi:hypothetical protein